jgi:hypothetical protein
MVLRPVAGGKDILWSPRRQRNCDLLYGTARFIQ